MGVQEAIAELFGRCAVPPGSQTVSDFATLVKSLWPILDNNVSLCDLSGVFTISVPGRNDSSLDLKLFSEFLSAISRIKFSNHSNAMGLELLMNEVVSAKSVHFGSDSALFSKLVDKQVIRVLLKFDLPLRRAFSSFAGSAARVGGGLNWDDVKAQNIGMEVIIHFLVICRHVH